MSILDRVVSTHCIGASTIFFFFRQWNKCISFFAMAVDGQDHFLGFFLKGEIEVLLF